MTKEEQEVQVDVFRGQTKVIRDWVSYKPVDTPALINELTMWLGHFSKSMPENSHQLQFELGDE